MTWLLGLLSPRVLAGLGLVIAIAAGLSYVDHRAANRQALIDSAVLKGKEADWATERAIAAAAAASASEAYRSQEHHWQDQLDKVQANGQDQIAAAVADRAAADARAASLRITATAALNALRRGTPEAPATAAECAAAYATARVFRDLFGRCDALAGVLASYADAARIAGQACVATYEVTR